MPKNRLKKKQNVSTLAYFTGNDTHVQNDSAFFNFARYLLRYRTEFSIFPKPVCFASFLHQHEFKLKNENLMKSCACTSTFYRSTTVKKDYHIALVEGRCHPTRYSLPRPPPTHYEFHSCILVVDKVSKSIFVFNPWKVGARPLVMNSVEDLQPKLVLRIVKKYPTSIYKTYYLGGNQTHQTDCRYRMMCVLKKLGSLPNCSLLDHFDWIPLN